MRGGQPQAGDGPRGRDRARAGRHRARARRPPADGADRRRAARGRRGELQPMWADGARDRARCGPCWPAPAVLEQRILRLFGVAGVRDRRDAARRRGATACRSTGSRSRPACGAARSRSRPSSRPRPRPTTRRSRRRCASATATRCSRARRRDDRRAGRGALLGPPAAPWRSAESCTGGLMAARLTDRAGSSRVRAGRRRGLLQRGQGRRWRASRRS